jgi:hypothetical protein
LAGSAAVANDTRRPVGVDGSSTVKVSEGNGR